MLQYWYGAAQGTADRYQTRRIISEITRAAVITFDIFKVFIAHESNFTMISSIDADSTFRGDYASTEL